MCSLKTSAVEKKNENPFWASSKEKAQSVFEKVEVLKVTNMGLSLRYF